MEAPTHRGNILLVSNLAYHVTQGFNYLQQINTGFNWKMSLSVWLIKDWPIFTLSVVLGTSLFLKRVCVNSKDTHAELRLKCLS